MDEFNNVVLSNLAESTSREWLETNGLGGFASSTIIGLNTRRYHGLLTAATQPPTGRLVLLSKLEETLVIDGQRFDLSANEYPGVIYPQGFKIQTSFRLDPFPVFTYEVAGYRIEKSIFMVWGENTSVVQYRCESIAETHATDATLEIRPLVAFRDYHFTTHENPVLNQSANVEPGLTWIKPYADLPALYFAHDDCLVDIQGSWYRNFQYSVERERGLDSTEDLFNPFCLTFAPGRAKEISILVSTSVHSSAEAQLLRTREQERRKGLEREHPESMIQTLLTAADQFIVARGDQKTVIAGYHWFSDWGRDTMISLPGLTLVTGRYDLARQILLEFSKYVDRGMLPNRFPDVGETPEYNTVDATLWFFEAIRALVERTGDYDFVRKNLFPLLKNIIDWHIRGTRYGIRLDEDGLLLSGAEGVQLTWMDARVNDWVVTPRAGKPVEIQALWYNALRIMEHFAKQFGDQFARSTYSRMADQALDSFNKVFWNEATHCLFDVVGDGNSDGSIRPNQLFALSLEYPLVAGKRAVEVMKVVERELLTPRGLRSLSRGDGRYKGRYEGGPAERDGAYHEGTVWAWLIGPYLLSATKVFGESTGRELARAWLSTFAGHLSEACIGQVSEIFDGDAPHTPRGCVAQAWSVAELLRIVESAYPEQFGCKAFSNPPTT